MKAPISVSIAVLFCALALGCSYANRIAEARSDSSQTKNGVRAVAANPAAVRPDWRLGSPVTRDNLTIFPVLSDTAITTDEYITLDEGMKSRKVTITEIGANGSSRPTSAAQQSGDQAEVNLLMVTNNSGKTLVLIAGEIVIGGKQDRIVGHDCLVSSTGKPVPLEVFCVEHGRWQPRDRSATGGAANNYMVFNSQVDSMASPNVREKAQAKKDQSQVWAEVSKAERANGVSSSTGTLNRVIEDKQVNAKLDAFSKEVGAKLVDNNIVGAIVAIGGEVVSADVFANSSLFQAYWPKLLKSYSLQAINSEKRSAGPVDRSAAEAFLERAAGEGTAGGKEGIYRLTERNGASDASFELVSDSSSRKLIHFNRVNKK